jgi:hypothetical protein
MGELWADMMADPWLAGALALAALGVGLIIAARFSPALGGYARAVLVTAVSAAVVSFALRFDGPVYWFAAGFAVCAALHRWVDAVRKG